MANARASNHMSTLYIISTNSSVQNSDQREGTKNVKFISKYSYLDSEKNENIVFLAFLQYLYVMYDKFVFSNSQEDWNVWELE